MEIKTTMNIIEENTAFTSPMTYRCIDNPDDKWVKVDDVILLINRMIFGEFADNLDQLQKEIQQSVFGQCVCEDNYKCVRCKQLNVIYDIFSKFTSQSREVK